MHLNYMYSTVYSCISLWGTLDHVVITLVINK